MVEVVQQTHAIFISQLELFITINKKKWHGILQGCPYNKGENFKTFQNLKGRIHKQYML